MTNGTSSARGGSIFWLGETLAVRIDDPIDKLILIVLADSTFGEDVSYAPNEHIAAMACTTESEVRRRLFAMLERGWLTLAPHPGGEPITCYRLMHDAIGGLR